MRESSKAYRRRQQEQTTGLFKWSSVITGKLLDIGSGDDPYPDATVTFDAKDGDANNLSRYFEPASFDTLHASQSLEDMRDPRLALQDWLKLLKPSGHLVITVPSWELYEGMVWPPRFNGAHQSTWSLWQKGSPAGRLHVFVPDLCKWLKADLNTRVWRMFLCDANYDYTVGTSRDQTFRHEDNVEAFIELVIQKR